MANLPPLVLFRSLNVFCRLFCGHVMFPTHTYSSVSLHTNTLTRLGSRAAALRKKGKEEEEEEEEDLALNLKKRRKKKKTIIWPDLLLLLLRLAPL